MVEDESFGFSLLVLFYLLNRTKFTFYPSKRLLSDSGAPDKPCGVGRADANPKLLLNDT